MEIRIKTHSIVDIITNSSTVIYTWAKDNAVEMVLSLIDEVLIAAGSDKTADELYDVSIQVDRNSVEWVLEQMLADKEDDDLTALYAQGNDGYGPFKPYETWSEHWNDMLQYVIDNVPHDELVNYEDREGITPETVIVVTRKDGEDSIIDTILGNLFDTYSSYG